MPKNIEEIEFTIFDTETTGLNPAQGDRIVEIAGLRIIGNQKIGTFHSLVNPKREISPAAFAVNKITPEMLENAEDISMVLPRFLKFISGSCLCSYNARFDLDFLNNELKNPSFSKENGIIVLDILTMARRLLPDLSSHALCAVSKELGISKPQQHRALADVEMTWEVFNRLKAMCSEKGVCGFTNFSNLFAFNPLYLETSNEEKSGIIQKCIDTKGQLKLLYISSVGFEVTKRNVLPGSIRVDKKHRYLTGYCCLKKQERTFRLDNILQIEIV